MIRAIGPKDHQEYLRLVDLFYHSEAVEHTIPPEYYERTFQELLRSNDYLEGYLLLEEKETAGYALLAKTFSQEAGGMVWWIEELYLLPEYRGKGLGKAFFQWLDENRPDAVKRFRLEVEADNVGAKSLYAREKFRMLPYEQMIREFD
jgi:GNAT superfamily N-acetyltransferase